MTLKEKIIDYLMVNPGATDSEMEKKFNVRHQVVNSTCRDLVNKGILTRNENPSKENRIGNYLADQTAEVTFVGFVL